MTGPIKAVFFDFGGTLFSYRTLSAPLEGLVARGVERLAAEVDAPTALRAYYRARRSAWDEYTARPFYLLRDMDRQSFSQFAHSVGREASEEFIQWFMGEHRRVAVEGFELRPGCEDTLGELASRGLHVGIVSNIDDDYFEPMLARAGLERLTHARTSSEEARSCKPDPRIYHLALSKSMTAPAETLFVGDMLEPDIAGPGRLGMPTAWIREADSPLDEQAKESDARPDHVIIELREVLDIVG